MALMTLASTVFVTAATLAVSIAAGYVLLHLVMSGIERMFRAEVEPSATVVPFVSRAMAEDVSEVRRAA